VLFDVLRVLDRDDLEPDTLTVREPSIDDVFLALTGHHVPPDAIGPQVSATADPIGVTR
jgi:hypothetical protein